MSVEQLVECVAGEMKVLEKSVPHYFFAHHKSHIAPSGLEPGLLHWEAGD
jgi:hypothetical protein